jgi:YVTN family beta-propeller protein
VVCIHIKPGAVDIIDTTTLQRIKTVPIELAQHDIVMTGDDKYAITASQEGSITVVAIPSGQIAWDWKSPKGPVGPEPGAPAYSGVRVIGVANNPDGSGRAVLVSLGGLDGFAVVDFATHKTSATIRIPGAHTAHGGPGGAGPSHGVAITPDGKTILVNDRPDNAVYAYAYPSLEPIGKVAMPEHALPGKDPIGSFPFWITFTPDSKTAYVTDSWLRQVTAIDTKTMKVVANIPVGERPVRIATLVIP